MKRNQAAVVPPDEPALVSPPLRSSARAVGHPPASLNEDMLSGMQPHAALHQQIADRAFWEQWDTPLLWAWAYDYGRPRCTLTRADNHESKRELILNWLVTDGSDRPREGEEETELIKIWRKQTRAKKGAMPVRSRWAASSPSPPPAPSPAARPPPKAAARVYAPSSDDEEASDEEEPIPGVQCRVCAHLAFPNTAEWRCTSCGLRGDLAVDSHINTVLLAMKGHHAPAASPQQHGQPTSHTLAAASHSGAHSSALERELDRLRSCITTPQLRFTGAGALSPITNIAKAIAVVRKAHKAAATEFPSEALLELVRTGTLRHVGYAIPRPLQASFKAGANAVATLEMGEHGARMVSSAGTAPPDVASAQQFFLALVSTILPALIDRPAASLQWMALARTALEIESSHGWPAAARYVEQHLNECVAQGQDYADTSMAILSTIFFEGRGASYSAQSQGTQPHSDSTRVPFPPRCCDQYNWNMNGGCDVAGVLPGQSCHRGLHACQYKCSGIVPGHHRSRECPIKPPSRKEMTQAKQNRRSNSGRGGGGGGSTVASAQSAPASSSSRKA